MTSTPRAVPRFARALRAAPLLSTLALLSACGGGGGGAGAGAGGAEPGYTLTGVAAVGAPLAHARIEAWCSGGELGATTTTDAGGRFEAKLAAACASPWLLQAIQGDGTRISSSAFTDVTGPNLADGVRAVVLANITPMTELLTQSALEGHDFDDLSALASRLRQEGVGWQEMRGGMQDALALINRWRPAATPPLNLETIMRQPFRAEPGDPMDDLLEAFASQRGAVTMEALLEQVHSRGGDLGGGQPWKTVFGERRALTWSTTDCIASGAPVDPATVVLRMQDRSLEVTFASNRFAAPTTFTVGPGVPSDFHLIVDGDAAPFVRLRAYAGGNALDLFTQAGTPMITLSAGGASMTCTLSNPVRRADLVAFHPASRIRSVLPASGANGSCAASAAGAAYGYAISNLGDVRFNGTSLPPDWLDAGHAYYAESLQYGMGGPGPSYQVQLAALPTGQGIQGYYFSTVPYGMNCTTSRP